MLTVETGAFLYYSRITYSMLLDSFFVSDSALGATESQSKGGFTKEVPDSQAKNMYRSYLPTGGESSNLGHSIERLQGKHPEGHVGGGHP